MQQKTECSFKHLAKTMDSFQMPITCPGSWTVPWGTACLEGSGEGLEGETASPARLTATQESPQTSASTCHSPCTYGWYPFFCALFSLHIFLMHLIQPILPSSVPGPGTYWICSTFFSRFSFIRRMVCFRLGAYTFTSSYGFVSSEWTLAGICYLLVLLFLAFQQTSCKIPHQLHGAKSPITQYLYQGSHMLSLW